MAKNSRDNRELLAKAVVATLTEKRCRDIAVGFMVTDCYEAHEVRFHSDWHRYMENKEEKSDGEE